MDGKGPGSFGIGGSGEAWRVLPPPTQPWEACWASGSGPLPSRTPSSHMVPRGIGGRGGRRREANEEGPSGSEDREEHT